MIIIPIFIIIMVVFVIKYGTKSDMSYIIITVIFIVNYGTNFDVSLLLILACQSKYLWLLSQYLLFYDCIYCKIWY